MNLNKCSSRIGSTRILQRRKKNPQKVVQEEKRKRFRKCDQCLKWFSSGNSLKRHLVVHADERPYSCDKCSWAFKRRDLLARHIIRRHSHQIKGEGESDEPPMASILNACEGPSHDTAVGDVPVVRSKRQRRLAKKCLCCMPSSMSTHQEHQQHPKSHELKSEDHATAPRRQKRGGIHKCSLCGKGYSTKTNLKRHFTIHMMLGQEDAVISLSNTFKEEPVDVVPVYTAVPSTSASESLMVKVKEEPVEPLDLVSISPSLPSTSTTGISIGALKEEPVDVASVSVTAHSTSTSESFEGGLHKCPECRNGYTLKGNMIRHFRLKHSKSRGADDRISGLSTKSTLKSNTAASLSVSAKKSKKSPSIVSKKTKSNNQLKSNECRECGKVLASSKNTKRHMVIHKDERPFVCNFCSWTFKRKDTLAGHIQSVHGMGKEIAQALSRNEEVAAEELALVTPNPKVPPMRVGDKKDKSKSGAVVNRCPQCGLVVPLRRNLAIHMATHKNVRPFACRLCFWRFKRKDNLFMHLKRKHHKSEKVARKMAYDSFSKCGYNMRERCKRPASPPVEIPVPAKKKKYVPIPKPKPTPSVDNVEVIVIVGDIKFCTPGLMLKPPERVIHGCPTFDEWFREDMFRIVEELSCAPLFKEEPEYELSLLEMAELIL